MGLLLGMLGCTEPEKQPAQEDGFLAPTAVRVASPVNGETVGPAFDVSYEAGASVAYVRFFAAAETTGPADRPEDGVGTFEVNLEDGRYNCALVAYDEAGATLSRHDLTLRVEGGEDPWVTIVSPRDGAEVEGSVGFVVDASDDVELVDLYAAGEVLGHAKVGGVATFTIPVEGEVQIEAVGTIGGAEVARDTITLQVEAGKTPATSDWNERVLALIARYPTDGTYGYYWPEDDGVWYGTTQDVWYRDVLMSPGDPQHRSFCVGLTWEVLLSAFAEVDEATGGDGTFNGMTVDDMVEFRTDWFVRELYGDGVVSAVRNYGVGERVSNWEDVRPGDFIQFWRQSGSGHNNVFIDWARDREGAIEGVTYWSTQSSTDGVGYNTEYFGTSGSRIDPAYFFVARVYMPEDWSAW